MAFKRAYYVQGTHAKVKETMDYRNRLKAGTYIYIDPSTAHRRGKRFQKSSIKDVDEVDPNELT